MGKWTVVSGALVTVALMSFIDGMVSLSSMPFPVVVPFLLSALGFGLLAVVDPFMLSSVPDSFVSVSVQFGGMSNNDPYAQVRQRASFVLGTMLLLIGTSIALTMNGVGDGATGCASDGRYSAADAAWWPGFSLVFQSWMFLFAATTLFWDKCVMQTQHSGPMLDPAD